MVQSWFVAQHSGDTPLSKTALAIALDNMDSQKSLSRSLHPGRGWWSSSVYDEARAFLTPPAKFATIFSRVYFSPSARALSRTA